MSVSPEMTGSELLHAYLNALDTLDRLNARVAEAEADLAGLERPVLDLLARYPAGVLVHDRHVLRAGVELVVAPAPVHVWDVIRSEEDLAKAALAAAASPGAEGGEL